MEEEKAAAYYDEMTRKGEGAARFKQGLGFSSSNDVVSSRGSALPSSSSFLSKFVRASSPNKTSDLEKEAQLATIQNKLSKKKTIQRSSSSSRVSNHREKHSRHRSRSRSPKRDDRRSRHRHRSSSRDRDRGRYRDRDRERDTDRDRDRDRRRKRSVSPRDRKLEKSRGDGIDYAKSIEGYDKMSPAERVKAKMKLQLSETAKKDTTNGNGPGWERFDFDKDAPLDDEEIEAVEDDTELVKHIGQSFRFSAVEARIEEKIKTAHDEAMFGAPSLPPPSVDTDSEVEVDTNKKQTEITPATSLISNQVLAMHQGSWRDRARKVRIN